MAADDMNFEQGSNDGPHELVEFSKFKGRPVISLRKTPEDRYPFTFGLGKARMIVDNYEVIEDFVNKHSGEKD